MQLCALWKPYSLEWRELLCILEQKHLVSEDLLIAEELGIDPDDALIAFSSSVALHAVNVDGGMVVLKDAIMTVRVKQISRTLGHWKTLYTREFQNLANGINLGRMNANRSDCGSEKVEKNMLLVGQGVKSSQMMAAEAAEVLFLHGQHQKQQQQQLLQQNSISTEAKALEHQFDGNFSKPSHPRTPSPEIDLINQYANFSPQRPVVWSFASASSSSSASASEVASPIPDGYGSSSSMAAGRGRKAGDHAGYDSFVTTDSFLSGSSNSNNSIISGSSSPGREELIHQVKLDEAELVGVGVDAREDCAEGLENHGLEEEKEVVLSSSSSSPTTTTRVSTTIPTSPSKKTPQKIDHVQDYGRGF